MGEGMVSSGNWLTEMTKWPVMAVLGNQGIVIWDNSVPQLEAVQILFA